MSDTCRSEIGVYYRQASYVASSRSLLWIGGYEIVASLGGLFLRIIKTTQMPRLRIA